MTMLKTVPVPDRGISHEVKPHAIDPRAWVTLDGFRTRVGTIRSFEGWDSITWNKGTVPFSTPVLGMIEYFRPLTQDRTQLVLSNDRVWNFDINSGFLDDITGTATLSASPAKPWSMVVYGGRVHMASLDTDGMFRWDGGVSGSVPIERVPNAPTFAFINTLNDYLLGLYERVGSEHYPYSFRWSAEASDEKWIADDTVDAGDFDIRDSPDKGVALYKLGDDMIVYKERTIVPVTFIGGNEIFGRRAAVAGVGLIGPYALAAAGDRHIFMGQETFYSYTGGNVVDDSIGDPIRELVYGDLNPDVKDQVRTIYLRESLEIVWFYPSKTNFTGTGCDKAVIYNLKDGTWAGPMSIRDYITFCANFTEPEPRKRNVLGSKVGHIYGHGSSYTENGTRQLRVMESGDHNLQTDATLDNGNRVFYPLSMVFQVNVVNLDVEAIDGVPLANFFIGSRLDLNDPISWQGPFVIGGGPQQTIRVPVRRTGRWFRIKIETDAILEFALQNYQFEFEWVGNR